MAMTEFEALEPQRRSRNYKVYRARGRNVEAHQRMPGRAIRRLLLERHHACRPVALVVRISGLCAD